MHGSNLVLFSLVGRLLSDSKLSRTHAYNIYRYSADRKNNYFFERKLPKNLVD